MPNFFRDAVALMTIHVALIGFVMSWTTGFLYHTLCRFFGCQKFRAEIALFLLTTRHLGSAIQVIDIQESRFCWFCREIAVTFRLVPPIIGGREEYHYRFHSSFSWEDIRNDFPRALVELDGVHELGRTDS